MSEQELETPSRLSKTLSVFFLHDRRLFAGKFENDIHHDQRFLL